MAMRNIFTSVLLASVLKVWAASQVTNSTQDYKYKSFHKMIANLVDRALYSYPLHAASLENVTTMKASPAMSQGTAYAKARFPVVPHQFPSSHSQLQTFPRTIHQYPASAEFQSPSPRSLPISRAHMEHRRRRDLSFNVAGHFLRRQQSLPPGTKSGNRDKVAAWAARAALQAGRREILAARIAAQAIKSNDTFAARAADRMRVAAGQARITAVQAAEAERESKAAWEQLRLSESEHQMAQAAASAPGATRREVVKEEAAKLKVMRNAEIAAAAETRRVEAWQSAARAWTDAHGQDGKDEARTIRMKRAALVAAETAQKLLGERQMTLNEDDEDEQEEDSARAKPAMLNKVR
eukprot:gnl/MRDRNA2_/MRDRNA2_96193_c0_seq1.p1 gnl/MRDRNA2_/MRDRNA2_96193_c0~~gnl/MRDRNA2_/MRDRNA2_96193_c0_seq1.p1  ORF type:complete len:352 (+),score=81.26 gnl/MRDRNA2_/MRDRNA2_96193_c0_seq1:131-1186(+)